MKKEESLLNFLNAATNRKQVFLILSAVQGVYRKLNVMDECCTQGTSIARQKPSVRSLIGNAVLDGMPKS